MKIARPLALLLALLFAHHSIGAPEVPRFEERVEALDREVIGGNRRPQLLIVHYHRQDGVYDGWNLWSWTEGSEGAEHAFDGGPLVDAVAQAKGETEFGRYAVIEVPWDAERQGLIVRKNNWEARDGNGDRWVELDGDRVTEVWLVAGNETVFTDPADIDLSVRFVSAFLDDAGAVTFTTTAPLDRRALGAVSLRGRDATIPYRAAGARRSSADATGGIVYTLPFSPPVRREHLSHLTLHAPGFEPVTVYARDALDDPRFTAEAVTLGPIYTPEATTFRVWSPVSDSVTLLGYRDAGDEAPSRRYPMEQTDDNVWEVTVNGDLDGLVYEYVFESYTRERRAADINALAATADSRRSVVVNLDKTDPSGWNPAQDITLEHPTDEVIYEAHVRDFSIRDPSLEPALRGTYAGLVHEGEVGGVATGLAHLKELGVTAVHLLPVHDFPSSGRDEYSWGYWTTLFNVPESNYASPGAAPDAVIAQLKTAIMGLHDAGLRVILDVVYNHTSSSHEHSHFDNTVPFYYFRTTIDGRYRNDAGVGNSIADERTMVRKYVSDSLMHWAREYRVDGFRFDLIGTHHPESVRAWVDRLRDFRADLTIYGEPWTGGGPTYFPKGAQRSMRIAVFNDHLRNAIRGDLDGDAQGFATGPHGDVGAIKRGVMGAIDDFADSPTETINYASAHDNLTLWDKIVKVNPDANDDTRRDMQKLALAIVLTSQGTPFLHGGSDFCRTKQGNHNSYNAGDDINAFDWERKAEYQNVSDYTRGLIELRERHPAFRMHETGDVRRHLSWLDTNDDRVVAYHLDGAGVGDEWDGIIVVYNGSDIEQVMPLPEGDWHQVVDREHAGVIVQHRRTGDLKLPAYSAAVLYK